MPDKTIAFSMRWVIFDQDLLRKRYMELSARMGNAVNETDKPEEQAAELVCFMDQWDEAFGVVEFLDGGGSFIGIKLDAVLP
jgi:hypothetical protein